MGTPTIGGDIVGAVTEDSGIIIGGDLDDVGVATGNTDDLYTITVAATYGLATIDLTTGTWSYDLDDSNPVVNALGAGDLLNDTFTVQMEDTGGIGAGVIDTQVITITITGVPCFTRGTLINTSYGLQSVESLRVGDHVITEDGPSDVLWIGRRFVSAEEMRANEKLRPIRILAGALGNGLPRRDLVVSRQHRMMLRSKIAERMFGEKQVLLPAVRLTGLPGIFIDKDAETVEYFHILLENHAIIKAEGAPTESLFTGTQLLEALSEEARDELLTLFPEIADLDHAPEPARFIPPGKKQKRLIERHIKNQAPALRETP